MLVTGKSLRKSLIEVDYAAETYALWEGQHGEWPVEGEIKTETSMAQPGQFRYLAQLSGNTPGANGEFELMRLVFEKAPAGVVFNTPPVAGESMLRVADPSTTAAEPSNIANWPTSPTQQNWLRDWYMPLAPLNAPFSVYGDAEWERRAEEVFRLTNAERIDKHHTPLTRDPHLDAVAQAMAQHMAEAGFFDHEDPHGMDVFDRLDAVNTVDWWTAGENIAAGYANPAAVHKGWMDSKGHKKNIRNEDYRAMGVGVYHAPGTQLGWYWVQVFATFKDDASQHAWIEPGM